MELLKLLFMKRAALVLRAGEPVWRLEQFVKEENFPVGVFVLAGILRTEQKRD